MLSRIRKIEQNMGLTFNKIYLAYTDLEAEALRAMLDCPTRISEQECEKIVSEVRRKINLLLKDNPIVREFIKKDEDSQIIEGIIYGD